MSVSAFITSGRLRPIANMAAERSQLFPELPTLREAGPAFKDFDAYHTGGFLVRTPDRLMKALAAGDLNSLPLLMHNDLSHSAQRLCPDIIEILDEGLDMGGIASIVSGSGPTVAFLCHDPEDAIELAVGLSTMPQVRAVHRAKGPVPGARVVSGR